MRDLQVSPPRFKITKLRFGILGRVNTFARAKVLRSATLSAVYNYTKKREGAKLSRKRDNLLLQNRLRGAVGFKRRGKFRPLRWAT